MRTLFYNRTPYVRLKQRVPECFIELDCYFGEIFQSGTEILQKHTILAENICHRMADVEVYAEYISEELKRNNAGQAAIYIGTLLVGFFTACKSLLGAGAIALNEIYQLEIDDPKKQDFRKGTLWNRLRGKGEHAVYNRYSVYKDLIDEIVATDTVEVKEKSSKLKIVSLVDDFSRLIGA